MKIPAGLNPYFRAIAYIGLGLMAVDTIMSATFGLTIGYIPMIGLALISLGSGLLLVAAEFFRRIGWTPIAAVTVGVWFLAFTFNAWSNMGVATSTRMGEVQQATVQQTTYAERQKAAEEAALTIKNFTAQLDDLRWAPVVTASSLRDQIAETEAMAERESRRGGCGRICEGHKANLVELQKQLGAVEKRTNIEKQIAATEKVLAEARGTLAETKAGISATANQSTLYAKLISFNLADNPDASAVTVANESTGIAMAIVIAIASAFLTLVGALPHLTGANPSLTRYDPPAPRPATPLAAKPHVETEAHDGHAMVLKYFEGNGDTRTWLAQAIDEAKAKARAAHGVAA